MLERLSLMPVKLFFAAWVPFLVVAAIHAAATPLGPIPRSVLVIAGMFLWTLFEYAMHRVVFHLKPRSPFGRRIMFLIHGNHHQNPSDELRNIMPLCVSLTFGALLFLLFQQAPGGTGAPLFFGFVLGYVLYDGVHYACHQWPMGNPVLASLKRHHLRHHHGNSESNFAITFILWDQVFGSQWVLGKRR